MAAASEPAGDAEQRSGWKHRPTTAFCLVASGVCFTLFPSVRPFFDESLVTNGVTYASPAWWIAHSFGMAGFVLFGLGILGLYLGLMRTRVEPLLWWTLLLYWIGTGLTIAFFGAEAFSLPIIGRTAAAQNSSAILALVNEVRFGPAIGFVLLGLGLIGIAAILLARAIWTSGVLSKWSGVPFAVGFAVYIPILQGGFVYQMPRIFDGLLILVGGIWIGWQLLQKRTPA